MLFAKKLQKSNFCGYNEQGNKRAKVLKVTGDNELKTTVIETIQSNLTANSACHIANVVRSIANEENF